MSIDKPLDDVNLMARASRQSDGAAEVAATEPPDRQALAGTVEGLVRVDALEALKQRGCMVITGKGHTIAVFYHGGQVYAVDNRCPHMGFPLDRGTVKDGILTCHWHHARFDLSSGGTFDPFADDVRAFPVALIGDGVWVDPSPPPRDPVQHWSTRLQEGLEHNIRLVIAKSVLGLQAAGATYHVPLRVGTQFGMTYSAEGWGPAMSILTCIANILPHLAGYRLDEITVEVIDRYRGVKVAEGRLSPSSVNDSHDR